MTAYIYDELGVALVNAPVVWTAENITWASRQTTTNFAGATTITFTSVALNNDITAILTATAGTAESSLDIALRGVTIDVSATPTTVIADGGSPSRIDVHIFETTSQIGVNGADVSFGTDRGTIRKFLDNELVGSGIRDAVRVHCDPGTATVTASYGNILSAQTTVTFAESTPTTLSLTASPTIMLGG